MEIEEWSELFDLTAAGRLEDWNRKRADEWKVVLTPKGRLLLITQ